MLLVLLRCDIFQGRSASVGVSLKKSVVGSVTVFIRCLYVCTKSLSATVQGGGRVKNSKELLITELCIITSDKF